jgi:hypothetical protein
MWDDVDVIQPSWGGENDSLTAYCKRYSVKNTTNLWVDWDTLKEMLLDNEPTYTDHRLPWWCGQEPGMGK